MQFRFQGLAANYHANHFLYEIERSKEKLEILEALNKKAKRMSKSGELIPYESNNILLQSEN